MNKDSSRSHSIFTVYLEIEEKVDDKNSKIKAGKLNLVDLAGSERQSKTEATGQRLKEATKINLSLSALGNVIAALVSGKAKHIPYRDSKLTRLLEDSLGGNTKTLMIAAISPADDNYDETLGTLKYANRAKQIKNKPKINEDPKDAMLRKYQEELAALKAQLKGGAGAVGPGVGPGATPADIERLNRMKQAKLSMESQNKNMENRLRNNENLLQSEKQKREELERKLKELQKAMVHGGEGNGGADFAEFEEMKHNNEVWEKEQDEKHHATEKASNPMYLITDDLDEMKKKYDKLYQKYKQVNRDVRDQEYENAKEKSDILDTLRYQERELDFLKQIASMILSENELKEIRKRVDFEEDEENFEVPDFYFIEHKNLSNLPTLPGGKSHFPLQLPNL